MEHPMSAELARRWFTEVWREGGEATVMELMAEDCIGQMEGADIRGRAQFLIARQQMMDTFPDLQLTVDDLIAQGDQAAVRWQVRATHHGGGLGVPATGQPVTFRGQTWMEFRNGKIVRGWDSWNLGGLIQSLAPAPKA
jgi:steroid delta-isomerase-like uncharacterized protein